MSDYNYLDKAGLTTLWSKIKSYIAGLGYTTNKGTVGGSGTSGYLAKWTGTTAVGNGPQLGNSTATFLRNDGNWATPTGTTYSTATTAANGLMSSTDKVKLNSVASSAEVNQNAFSNVVVGSSTVAADSKTDTLTLVGSGSVSLSANTSSDTITISGTDTTYSSATTATAGLMSTTDKIKLNSIASSAAVNVIEKIQKNGSDLTISNKTVNIIVPTSVSQLSNDSGFVTTNTTYSAGTGLSLSGTEFNHSNSITAGTAGSTSASVSTGSTVEIPYVTYDTQGHITSTGTHKHIVPVSEGGDSNITATVASGVLIFTIDTTTDGTEEEY